MGWGRYYSFYIHHIVPSVNMLFGAGIVPNTDMVKACNGVNAAVMIGGFLRKYRMEREYVRSKNASLYKYQASALEKYSGANYKLSAVDDKSLDSPSYFEEKKKKE